MRPPFVAALVSSSLLERSSATPPRSKSRGDRLLSKVSRTANGSASKSPMSPDGMRADSSSAVPTTWFFRRNPSPCELRPPRLTHSGPGETRVGPARLWERWSLVRSVSRLGPRGPRRCGIQSRTSTKGRLCRSAEGLDWLGARSLGDSSVSPYLSGTAATPSLPLGSGNAVVEARSLEGHGSVAVGPYS
jgi:hypothetical protein